MKLFYTLLLCLCGTFVFAQNLNPYTVSQSLQEQVAAQPDAWHEVLILLEDKVDTRALDADFYARNLSLQERNVELITTLKAKANSTQPPLLSQLENSDQARNVRSFWITNLIYAEVRTSLLVDLSNNRAIESIELNEEIELADYAIKKSMAASPPVVPNGKEPGLRAIGAPELWAMGYTGYGRVACTVDTGVDPSHPALVHSFRGDNVPIGEAWLQEVNNAYPFDCDDHGTHVTGTIVGLDRATNDTIGVAFDAEWIASPSISCLDEGFNGIIGAIGTFQWALNPDGNLNTIDDMPDIINNSWVFTQGLSCGGSFQSTLNTLETTKIAVVFAAGNAGPEASTIPRPANINTDLVNTFSVGALNGNGSLFNIAGFSSRGPTNCPGEGSLAIKPEVSAPGASVRSAVRGGDYDFLSGTSMAAPHVSGAILLLREAFPEVTGTEVKMALYMTAIDLGEEGEDNDYGMGMISVPAAYEYLIEQGHEPVPPTPRDLDAVAINIEISETETACPGNLRFLFSFENAGSENITSLTINYTVDGMENTFEWTGNVPPNGIRTLVLEESDVSPGIHDIQVELSEPNGMVDNRPLNDKIIRRITVEDRPPLDVYPEGSADSYCEENEVLLRADYNGPGNYEVEWYEEALGGAAIGEGQIFSVSDTGEEETYYAEAKLLLPTGQESIGFSVGTALVDEPGLQFDAFRDLRIRSVLMYFEEPGLRLIRLKTGLIDHDDDEDTPNQSVTIGTKIVNLEGESPARVDLFFNVPQGNNYKLFVEGAQQSDPVFISTEGADFPYEIEGVIQIEQSLAQNFGVSLTEYHCFYDWEIEIPDPCGRVPVTVNFTPGDTSPTVDFSVSAEEVFLASGASVDFSHITENAVSFAWNFGDGTQSDEENPTHAFTEEGTYTVSLTAFDAQGCSAFATREITVIDDTTVSTGNLQADWDIQIFPNPTTGTLLLDFNFTESQSLSYFLTDAYGRRIFEVKSQNFGYEQRTHNLDNLTAGVYWIIFEGENERMVRKVVKM